jgi:hypothetical protein
VDESFQNPSGVSLRSTLWSTNSGKPFCISIFLRDQQHVNLASINRMTSQLEDDPARSAGTLAAKLCLESSTATAAYQKAKLRY